MYDSSNGTTRPLLTSIIFSEPERQKDIDQKRRELHNENMRDLMSLSFYPMSYDGDPEYGEFDTGAAPIPDIDFRLYYSDSYPVPRQQIAVDRGAYQKKLAQYYDIPSNFRELQPLDTSKFYLVNGEEQNHFTPEMIFYMNVLYDQVAHKIGNTDKGRILITSGFRSVAYNNALRAKSKGVATWSAHSGGIACDIYIPDSYDQRLMVLDTAYMIGFGGHGMYDTFVHIDIGGRATWGGYKGPKGV